MTVYTSELQTGQRIFIENVGEQTLVTLMSGGPGQQQSQRTGVDSGAWLAPPVLFRVAGGVILRLDTSKGQFLFQVQSSGLAAFSSPPSLANADVLPLRQATSSETPGFTPMEPMEPMKPMKPMPPMEPMKPMEPMPPMQMQMGSMKMQMGPPGQQAAPKRFCTRCGEAVGPEDRFCGHCGHRLVPGEV
ncbi:MAG: zinc ribbon domain-containing protein [Chloroflexaceae bacterium]|nr:zinc ribbon domain-containing protein [Chloroflexaceae bacterium]